MQPVPCMYMDGLSEFNPMLSSVDHCSMRGIEVALQQSDVALCRRRAGMLLLAPL